MYRDGKGLHTDWQEDQNFGADFLSQIVEYITETFEMAELYTHEQIADAAKDIIAGYYHPEDVYGVDELALWAAENGYVIAVVQE